MTGRAGPRRGPLRLRRWAGSESAHGRAKRTRAARFTPKAAEAAEGREEGVQSTLQILLVIGMAVRMFKIAINHNHTLLHH